MTIKETRNENGTKDYFYKGFRFYYCKHYRKWIIDDESEFIYMDSKKQAVKFIDYLAEQKKENQGE